MRSPDLSGFALSICAAIVMLAGCGGSQPPLPRQAGCRRPSQQQLRLQYALQFWQGA